MLMPLAVLQRLLHREIQAVILLITRNPQLTVGLFSVLFFPGVFLHEFSHFLMAKLLRVPTRQISLLPQSLSNGRLQMGYVETGETDILRDSLIGLAPLIAGTSFVAYAGIHQLQLHMLWNVLRDGQVDLFWMGLGLLPAVPDFYLWFYLTFAVSSTMLPSESDRHAWLPLGLWVAVLLALAASSGAGAWMLENLTPPLNNLLNSVALLFGLSSAVHVVLVFPFFALHRLLAYVMKVDVR
ncbi:MAG: hypothetical protein QY332_13745 [Anaerolineales bacterium]|nr:MAG: hypothetical protein QY332_13745 [Anaerolineales bacterium]